MKFLFRLIILFLAAVAGYFYWIRFETISVATHNIKEESAPSYSGYSSSFGQGGSGIGHVGGVGNVGGGHKRF